MKTERVVKKKKRMEFEDIVKEGGLFHLKESGCFLTHGRNLERCSNFPKPMEKKEERKFKKLLQIKNRSSIK